MLINEKEISPIKWGRKKKKPNIRISLCVFCADLKVLHCSDKISERPHLDMF